MYFYKNLKEKLDISENKICCPVKGCNHILLRLRADTKASKTEYTCPIHNIEVHASTFIYNKEEDNLLNKDSAELELLSKIRTFKRESRMQNEKSEDALTWNIFRYLQKENNKFLKLYLSSKFNDNSEIEDIIYWSYSLLEEKTSSLLEKARLEFGETKYGSEPDIIIITKTSVYFIEAKFTSSNNTSGDSKTKLERINTPKKYLTGNNNSFDTLFLNTSYANVINYGFYELMRLWLLGNYSARLNNKKFYLVNLVREKSELNIEKTFGKLINVTENRTFKRITWESIYKILANNHGTSDILEYFEGKTAGYSNGKLKKAFNI